MNLPTFATERLIKATQARNVADATPPPVAASPSPQGAARWKGAARIGRSGWGLLLTIAVCGVVPAIEAADSYSEVIRHHLELQTGATPPASQETETDAETAWIIDLTDAVQTEALQILKVQESAPPSASADRRSLTVAGTTLAATALLVCGIVGIRFKRQIRCLLAANALTEKRSQSLLVEDPSLAEFFRELQAWSHPQPDDSPATSSNGVQPPGDSEESPGSLPPLREFRASAFRGIASLQELLPELVSASDDARQEWLSQLHRSISEFKVSAESVAPQLPPVCLVVCALEGLSKHLAQKPADLTPSVLGTVAESVDLLEALCRPRVPRNLAIEPPIRLLAVDDDPVSRLAISFALKKAFESPEIASDGPAALGLIEQQTYDAIFLDVEMPAMDGFEVCTRIHQTETNRATPVIFVTRHSDFNSRAQAKLSGGVGLIAKPYHPFEITLKALSLVLRARLERGKPEAPHPRHAPVAATASVTTTPLLELATTRDLTTPPPPKPPASPTPEAPTGPPRNSEHLTVGASVTEFILRSLPEHTGDNLPGALFKQIPAMLPDLRQRLHAVRAANGTTNLPKLLGDLHLGVITLSIAAEGGELRLVSRLGFALEAALSHAQKDSSTDMPAVLDATAAALDVLQDLCDRVGPAPDLADPPVRILVADDDPIALRALTMVVQRVFTRPDCAGSGEAALALADENSYDLILLDVRMPGIDGFAACARIRETTFNRRTPVVFVTSPNDVAARDQAAASGRNCFISKPAPPSLLKLVALTFIIRSRVNKSEPPRTLRAAVSAKRCQKGVRP